MSSTSALAGALDSGRSVEQKPLTQSEVELLHRLLSDPTLLPREFKQWVTDHSSDTVDITKSQVHGLINSAGSIIFTAASWEQLGAALCPMIVPYPGRIAPKNWIPCDGRFLPEADYPQLFSFLGHTHDPFANTGNFAVPDMVGRTIFGYDEQAGTGYMAFGSHDSAAIGGRGPWHHHDITSHTHTHQHSHGLGYGVNVFSSGSNATAVTGGGTDTNTGGASFTETGGSGTLQTSGPPPLNSGAWIALNYIIASGQIPS